MWGGQQDRNGFGNNGFSSPGFGSPGFGSPGFGSPGFGNPGHSFGSGTVDRNREELRRDIEGKLRGNGPNQNGGFSPPGPGGAQPNNAGFGNGFNHEGNGMGNFHMSPGAGFGGVSGGYFIH